MYFGKTRLDSCIAVAGFFCSFKKILKELKKCCICTDDKEIITTHIDTNTQRNHKGLF